MPAGKGGQSGSQSQAQSGQTAGNMSTAGIQGMYQGSRGMGTSQAIAPTGYEDAWRSLMGGAGGNAGQNAAAGFFSNGGANSLLNPERSGWYGANERNDRIGAFTAPGSFEALYGRPTPTAPGQVTAQTGASQMAPYAAGYTNDVVNATTNDLLNQYGQRQNASNMAATAAGGIMNARTGLRDAQVQDDFLRTLGTTTAGLRDQGFSRAMQGGQFDASNALNASGQNANLGLNAQQFNNTLQNNRDQFGAQNAIAANQAQMANTATAAGIGTNAANSAAGIGGQQFNQQLAALGAGAPLFGQQNTMDNQAYNKGGNVGATDTAGASNSTGAGNSSSKGGGVSLG